jgi:hypothetical protein
MKRGTTSSKVRNTRNVWLSVLAFLVVGWVGSAAFALDPMGPPTAGLKQGQFQVGADYSYSITDLKLRKGSWIEYLDGWFYDSGEAESFTLKDFKTNKVYASLGYGIADNWEAFLRLGGADAMFGDSIWEDAEKFDSPTDFAIGFGVKATFYEEDNLKIGGLFQASWAAFNGKLQAAHWTAADSVKIDVTEIQIAVGPTYKLLEGVSIYGGPFFHFVNGDLDDKFSEMTEEGILTSKYSWAIRESSIFGGYIGVQVDVTENTSFNIGYQHTAKADALSMSLVWRF